MVMSSLVVPDVLQFDQLHNILCAKLGDELNVGLYKTYYWLHLHRRFDVNPLTAGAAYIRVFIFY